ncbi:camp-dependent protein kinase regulatory subunit [Chrysochromulina tobinii]|uniref:Camp-dependent protein kinase regulatory subunit n=1 Tax=Chrysochromulina tobinii TaxID=1460289 RepID=A0A0M0JK51_9EUKA|nr:camp-dependent protein kinase regulatory subunit [Chrysochromulina tobinii]|eukprot:KOO26628.1 camp-dependent protein kinase regulatory subunit [Chrysochromulina sp. CCMP291]
MMGSESFKKRSSPPHSSSVPLMPSIPMSTISVDASMRLINDRCDSPHTLFLRMRDKYKETTGEQLKYMEAVKSSDFDLFSRARVEVADNSVPIPPSKLEPFNPVKSFRVGNIEHVGMGEDLPVHVSQATHDFEKRHHRRAGRVAQLLQGLSNPKHESKKLNDAFEDGIGEVRRNRFFVELPVLGPYVGHASDWRKPLPMTMSEAEAGRAARLGGSVGDRRTNSKAKTWRVEDSVLWAPRKETSLSGDLYETQQSLRRMFEADWSLARRGHGLLKLIINSDDAGMRGARADREGELLTDEVEEVRETLFSHARFMYGVLDYYAGKDARNVKNLSGNSDYEPEVFDIGVTSLLCICRDGRLISPAFPARLIELIFLTVDAPEKSTVHLDKHNRPSRLNRHEFMEVIIRIAIEKYVRSGRIADVSDALEELFRSLELHLPPECMHNTNAFRARYLYIKSTSLVLRRHAPSLRALYVKYAEGNEGASANVLDTRSLLSLAEWLALLEHLGLFANEQLTQCDARLIFLWSRIRCCDDYSNASERALRNLSYQDFLEAIVRLAAILALPTDEEIAEAHAADGGQYLLTLEEQATTEFRRFVHQRKQPLERATASGPRQPIARCVDHLMHYVARIVEANTSREGDGAPNLEISQLEAANFAKVRTRGAELKKATLWKNVGPTRPRRGTEIFSKALEAALRTKTEFSKKELAFFLRDITVDSFIKIDGQYFEQAWSADEVASAKSRVSSEPKLPRQRATAESVVDSLRIVETRLMHSIASAEVFSELSPKELDQLRDCMVEVTFDEADWVFEQGEEGDALYVIISGTAETIRTEQGKGDVLLAQMASGDVFGSRALLRKETRYASVKATSKLKTMCLTRVMFERLNMRAQLLDKYASRSDGSVVAGE